MQHAHAGEVFAVASLVLLMAAGGFAAMLAAEARAVHHVQLELLPHGEAELHVFTAYLVVNYKVCGEDVELCLAMRQQLQLNVMYCPRFSGEHGGEATRSHEENQGGNSEDLTRMRVLHERFLNTANPDQLRVELAAASSTLS